MYIIVSSGERAARIASKFADSIIVDRDPDSAKRLEKMGFAVINKDASNPEFLSKFGSEDVIILADEDHFNIKVAKVARVLGLQSYAIVEDEENCIFYEDSGVSGFGTKFL
jgi:Trk K+ transport system NAD-binding subunit